MGIAGINRFFRELTSHQEDPADVVKYKRWIKELTDSDRKLLLEIINNPDHTIPETQLTDLYNEIQRIRPMVEAADSYEQNTRRSPGLYKSLCRICSNLFQKRTSSKEVLKAINPPHLTFYNVPTIEKDTEPVPIPSSQETFDIKTARQVIPHSQKALLDPNVFNLIADLPARKAEVGVHIEGIPDSIGKEPITIIYDEVRGIFLGLNLIAKLVSQDGSPSNKKPVPFNLLIRLNSGMKAWSETDSMEHLIRAFITGKSTLSKKEMKLFRACEKQDDPEMKDYCYDPRWLVTRLCSEDRTLLRHSPKGCFFDDIVDPNTPHTGYWELTLK